MLISANFTLLKKVYQKFKLFDDKEQVFHKVVVLYDLDIVNHVNK